MTATPCSRQLRVRAGGAPLCPTVALLLALCLATAPAAVAGHRCAHDLVWPRVTPVESEQTYHNHAHELTASHAERQRRLATAVWEPIRFTLVWGETDDNVTKAQRDFLRNTVMPEALAFWSDALNVQRTAGNLMVDRECAAEFVSNHSRNQCQRYEPPTCDSVTIPEYMLKPQEVCPEEDVCHVTTGGPGVPNTDYVLFVTAVGSENDICAGGAGDETIAYTTWCRHDQYDRPIMGRMNWCPSQIDPASPTQQRAIAMHEMAHALGFNPQGYVRFRDELGYPRTPRTATGEVSPEYDVQVNFPCDDEDDGVPLWQFTPAETTLKYFNERGLDQCKQDKYKPSSCVVKMVTPKVREMSRDFFDCDSLQGAELENQPTAPCNFFGSHWESRILLDALMAGFTSHNAFLTPMTLALFEDSGWYRANYSMATLVQPNVSWGFQQGCDFALNKCVAPKAAPVSTGTPAHFCAGVTATTDPQQASECTLDRRSLAFCYATTAEVPTWYQYFDNPKLVGGFAQADYCPYRKPLDKQGSCTNAANAPATNNYGQVYGTSSLCMQTTLKRSTAASGVATPMVGCYQVSCVSTSLLQVTVSTGSGVTTLSCSDGTTQHSVPGFSGSITCIDPAVYCANNKERVTEDESDDPGVVWLVPGELRVPPAPPTQSLTLGVIRFGGTLGGVTARVKSVQGTAIEGVDYASTTTTHVWSHGQDGQRTFEVQLLKRRYPEPVQFTVEIQSVDGAPAVTPTVARVTLGALPNDAAKSRPSASVAAVSMWLCVAAATLWRSGINTAST